MLSINDSKFALGLWRKVCLELRTNSAETFNLTVTLLYTVVTIAKIGSKILACGNTSKRKSKFVFKVAVRSDGSYTLSQVRIILKLILREIGWVCGFD